MPPGLIRVLVATKPVDFRKGMNGLAALVKEQLKADPFSGVIFCFRAKRADRVKLIFWDGTGLCLFAKSRATLTPPSKSHSAFISLGKNGIEGDHLSRPTVPTLELDSHKQSMRCFNLGGGRN